MMMMRRCCHSTCAMGVACWALLDGLRAIMGCDRHSGRDQFGTVVICLTALLPYLEGWCKNSPLVTGEQWHPSLSHPRQFTQRPNSTILRSHDACRSLRSPSRASRSLSFLSSGRLPASLDLVAVMLSKTHLQECSDRALCPDVSRCCASLRGSPGARRVKPDCSDAFGGVGSVLKRQSQYFSSCLAPLEYGA